MDRIGKALDRAREQRLARQAGTTGDLVGQEGHGRGPEQLSEHRKERPPENYSEGVSEQGFDKAREAVANGSNGALRSPVEYASEVASGSAAESSAGAGAQIEGGATGAGSTQPPSPLAASVPDTQGGNEKTKIQAVSPERLRENRVVAGLARDAEADIFRMLRAQVLKRLTAVGGRTLGVTSASPQEGKSLTAANLAVSLAMDVNHTVLLVDLDLRHPGIAKYFDLQKNLGLSDYLFGKATLSDCLVNPGVERLVVLPAGRALHNSSEILSSPDMIALINELKARYPDRLVLFDLPPMLSSDDTMVVMPHIESVLLVVQEGRSSADDVRRTLKSLSGYNILGTVLNQSSEEKYHPYY
ncbi:MAG: CpsD/CapB family tyrosine-protein kinase [Pseudomonadota bacterium]